MTLDLTTVPLNSYGHVQTRDGRPVRLLCHDFKNRYAPSQVVFGIVQMREDVETHQTWRTDGWLENADHNFQLIPVPKTVRLHYWVNVYADDYRDHSVIHRTRSSADVYATPRRIACIEIDREVTEGEGLETNK